MVGAPVRQLVQHPSGLVHLGLRGDHVARTACGLVVRPLPPLRDAKKPEPREWRWLAVAGRGAPLPTCGRCAAYTGA